MRPVDLAQAACAEDAVEFLDAVDAKAQAYKLKKYQQWLS